MTAITRVVRTFFLEAAGRPQGVQVQSNVWRHLVQHFMDAHVGLTSQRADGVGDAFAAVDASAGHSSQTALTSYAVMQGVPLRTIVSAQAVLGDFLGAVFHGPAAAAVRDCMQPPRLGSVLVASRVMGSLDALRRFVDRPRAALVPMSDETRSAIVYMDPIGTGGPRGGAAVGAAAGAAEAGGGAFAGASGAGGAGASGAVEAGASGAGGAGARASGAVEAGAGARAATEAVMRGYYPAWKSSVQAEMVHAAADKVRNGNGGALLGVYDGGVGKSAVPLVVGKLGAQTGGRKITLALVCMAAPLVDFARKLRLLGAERDILVIGAETVNPNFGSELPAAHGGLGDAAGRPPVVRDCGRGAPAAHARRLSWGCRVGGAEAPYNQIPKI